MIRRPIRLCTVNQNNTWDNNEILRTFVTNIAKCLLQSYFIHLRCPANHIWYKWNANYLLFFWFYGMLSISSVIRTRLLWDPKPAALILSVQVGVYRPSMVWDGCPKSNPVPGDPHSSQSANYLQNDIRNKMANQYIFIASVWNPRSKPQQRWFVTSVTNWVILYRYRTERWHQCYRYRMSNSRPGYYKNDYLP